MASEELFDRVGRSSLLELTESSEGFHNVLIREAVPSARSQRLRLMGFPLLCTT